MERLKSTLGILMWFVVSTVIAYHIGILDQNPMLGTRNFSLWAFSSGRVGSKELNCTQTWYVLSLGLYRSACFWFDTKPFEVYGLSNAE